MCKSEIFATILQTVSQETEIPPEQILSRKKDEETVDARYLLVYLLTRNGRMHTRGQGLLPYGSCRREARRTSSRYGFRYRKYLRFPRELLQHYCYYLQTKHH